MRKETILKYTGCNINENKEAVRDIMAGLWGRQRMHRIEHLGLDCSIQTGLVF